jgi:hypothetical protein
VYGAEVNNLLPAFAGISLLVATWRTRPLLRDGLLVLQLAWLVYSPAALVPTAADRAAGDEIVRRLSAVPGEVFLPHHGYLARLAGKQEGAHTLAMDKRLPRRQGSRAAAARGRGAGRPEREKVRSRRHRVGQAVRVVDRAVLRSALAARRCP